MNVKLNYKEKVNRYVPCFYELGKKHDLGANEMLVYGYIYNVCMQLNDNGWCGYSNERMANELGIGLTQFKLYLKRLKDNELIIVENPGKRAKKAGESRMIRINPANYITVEEQETIDGAIVEQLQEENKQLKDLVKKLEGKLKTVGEHVESPNWVFADLWKKGFFTDEEYKYPNQYNSLFEMLLRETSMGTAQRFIIYLGEKDPKRITNKYAYVAAAIQEQINQFRDRRTVEEEVAKYD